MENPFSCLICYVVKYYYKSLLDSSLLHSRGTLRDDTKSGYVADHLVRDIRESEQRRF